jgi:hypothetical protein
MGLTLIVPEVVSSSFLQRIVPTEMRGRVFGFVTLITMGMIPIDVMLLENNQRATSDSGSPTGWWR